MVSRSENAASARQKGKTIRIVALIIGISSHYAANEKAGSIRNKKAAFKEGGLL